MTSKNGTNKAEWEAFVNIRLETNHKKEIKDRVEKLALDDLLLWLFERVDDGYKITLSPDFDNGAVVATMTGATKDNRNAGLSMSQRHADPIVALVAMRYAHDVIASGGEWEQAQWDWKDVEW